MSSKRITINKILSNESLVQENLYFQVRTGGPRRGRVVPSDTTHILTASRGNDQGVMAHDRGKGLHEHLVQPSSSTPL